MTETVERELRAIDDALSSGRVSAADAVERELQELALALEADRAVPDADYERQLSERVRAGFPRRRRLGGVPRPLRSPRTLGFAGAATTLLVVVGVALSLQGGGEDDETTLREPGQTTTELEAAPRGTAAEPIPPPGGDFTPGRDRAIERSAQLTLAAPADDLDRVADEVMAVTDRHRGYVLRSSVTTGDEGSRGGTFELRIPAERLRPALAQLAQLGDVRSRTQSGDDVTREVAGVADRLKAARAERRSLLRRLERAETDEQADAIRRRLGLVAGEIRGLRGQARELRLRTNYAAVSVELAAESREDGGGLGSTGDALDDALGSLAAALNFALRALGVLLPFALLGGVLWLAGRTLLRRRREAALS